MTEIIQISPFKCRMWAMHDRHAEDLCARATRQLIDSIRLHGQRHPVLGRWLPAGKVNGDEHIELIYGARRLAAMRELGEDIAVQVREIDDRTALIEMDIENRIREDISPYERGVSYRRWLRSGMFSTQCDLSKALGISEAQVCRLLKFADLPAVVVSAFRSHRDICEDWAGVLVKLHKSPEHRDGVLRRARALSNTHPKPAPEEIYNQLISDGCRVLASLRVKDEVVKSKSGHTLFRIGVRARAVHLIVPRILVSSELLQIISDDVRLNLESALSKDGDA